MHRNPDILALSGRICVAALFVWSGWTKVGGFQQTAAFIAGKGLPMPEVLAAATVLVELGLGLMVAFGWKTRLAALIIALWLIPTTYVFHSFWSGPDAQVQVQLVQFMKNVAIFGAMLLLMAFGPGRMSVEGRTAGMIAPVT